MLSKSTNLKRVALAGILAGYVAMLVFVTLAIIRCEAWAKATYGTPAAQAKWEDWKEEARTTSKNGPVQRRVSDSAQPPLAVLFQEHFVTLLISAIFFATLVYGAIIGLAYGSVFGRGQKDETEQT